VDIAKTMLNVTALGIRRSERWLFKELTFALAEGEALQIFGENGSGKTSLLRCLCGLLGEAEGKVVWDESVHPIFLGHLAAVKTELSVYENLSLHPIATKFPLEDDILKAIIEVDLAGYEEELARRLSAGQIRRVALARLLLADSKCWILDEPFTSLDAVGCKWLEQLISKFIESGGSVIITSHQAINFSIKPRQITLDKNKVWEGDE